MNNDTKHVLIINPASSEEYLSEQFKKHAVKCTAVFTFDQNNSPSHHDHGLFDEQIFTTNDDPSILSNLLKSKNFDYIINGSEQSTELTDKLIEILLPQFNNSSKSSIKRFDKYAMMQAIESSGLSSISTRMIDTHDIDESKFNDLNFPVFCKPNAGRASVGSFKVDSKMDLIERLSFYKKDFSDYLIQEYIEGREYVVDAFSVNGVHHINSIMHYKKENYYGVPMYRYVEVENDKTTWDKCKNYIIQTLDALEVKNGFTHNEIMMDEKGDLKLIELNNRISGFKGGANKISKMCGLIPQDEMLINFLKTNKIIASDFQKMQGFARCLLVFNFTNGSIIKDPQRQLSKFASVKEVVTYKKPGETNNVSNIISLNDAVCAILLHNSNYQKLEQDSEEIFSLEKQGLLV